MTNYEKSLLDGLSPEALSAVFGIMKACSRKPYREPEKLAPNDHFYLVMLNIKRGYHWAAGTHATLLCREVCPKYLRQ